MDPIVESGVSRIPFRAGVAQLVEQLIRNQQVLGSSPSAGSRFSNKLERLVGLWLGRRPFDAQLDALGVLTAPCAAIE